jgi:hypothetical protein
VNGPQIDAHLNTYGSLSKHKAPSVVQHNHGARHYISLGIGSVALVATTDELVQLIDGLYDVLRDLRIADMRAVMAPLPEVAQ